MRALRARRVAERRSRRQGLTGNKDFGRWLRRVIERSPLKGEGEWSNRLAEAMGRGPEYDAALRRIVDPRSPRVPKIETTYDIGEGLRAGGLSWCSGLLALYRHQEHYFAALRLLSSVSEASQNDATFRKINVVSWLQLAQMLDALEGFSLPDDALLAPARNALADQTQILQRAVNVAWTKDIDGSVNGLLDLPYKLVTDPTIPAHIVNTVTSLTIKSWSDDILPADGEWLATLFAELEPIFNQAFNLERLSGPDGQVVRETAEYMARPRAEQAGLKEQSV